MYRRFRPPPLEAEDVKANKAIGSNLSNRNNWFSADQKISKRNNRTSVLTPVQTKWVEKTPVPEPTSWMETFQRMKSWSPTRMRGPQTTLLHHNNTENERRADFSIKNTRNKRIIIDNKPKVKGAQDLLSPGKRIIRAKINSK